MVIGENASLDDGVEIHAGSIIEANSSIGASSVIYSNVVLKENTVIGKHCILYSGCVIGSEGFGYAKDDAKWLAIPQTGRVVLISVFLEQCRLEFWLLFLRTLLHQILFSFALLALILQ